MERPRVHTKGIRHKRTPSRISEVKSDEDESEYTTKDEVSAGGNKPPPPSDGVQMVIETTTEEKPLRPHKSVLSHLEQRESRRPQTQSDPTASPGQRSLTRSILEKSPRHKRSKSESRRKRERKLIAAGEMEVRQANETLMRYLKQCSELNDASLSGDLEIDKTLDERRVHRKTKSQREKGGYYAHRMKKNQPSGLKSILNDLADDIVMETADIYNPFTPVISPVEGPPIQIEKMFIQTPHGYRTSNASIFKSHQDQNTSSQTTLNEGTRMSCLIQMLWMQFAFICRGLLGGLGLGHLFLIMAITKDDWIRTDSMDHYIMFTNVYSHTIYLLAAVCVVSIIDRMDLYSIDFTNMSDYISFRLVIILMIDLATIVLSLTGDSLVLENGIGDPSNNTEMLQKEVNTMDIWSPLMITRSICGISGWLLIGLYNSDDQLLVRLAAMDKDHITNNNNN